MMCEAVNYSQNAKFNNGLGCNISVTLSDGMFADNESQFAKAVSPKKLGFLDSFIQKNPSKIEKKSKTAQSNWTNIFTKKPAPEESKRPEETDEETAKLIAELRSEGKSEEEINMLLSHVHDVPRAAPAPVAPASPAPASPAPASPATRKGNSSPITQWFREVQQAIKEEFSLTSSVPYYYRPQYECDVGGLTVSISSAPFYGAPPPDMDLSYEQLASLEPVYVGAKCVNLLPCCKHDGKPLPGDQTNCSICLCEFSKGEQLKSLPACVHFFHQDCIDRWLMVGHTCPVCKTLVE